MQPDSVSAPVAPATEKEEARARILRAALTLFARGGLAATTTRQIAAEANVNVSLISYYFGGKESLYRSVIREHSESLERNIHEVLMRARTRPLSKESFCATVRALLEWLLEGYREHPAIKLILSREVQSGMPYSRDLFDEVFDRVTREVIAFLKQAQAAGIVRREAHAAFSVYFLIRAVDAYAQSLNCDTRLAVELPRLERDHDTLLSQLEILFLEGVLEK
jgi:TetR/AcrR family transcriptional regulator